MAAVTTPRLFIVAHNRNHVSIFGDAAKLVAARGHAVTFVVIEGHDDREAARAAASALAFPVIETSELVQTATGRDVVCVGNDWGPKHFVRKLESMRRRSVALVGAVEGARFEYPNHYKRVDDLLCWGPSALDVLPGRKHVVGSPAIERARRDAHPTPDRPRVLINYKFMKGSKELGPIWAHAAADGALAIDPDYILTAHPSNVGGLAGLNVSHAPFTSLIKDASLLITRSSTVIYEALVAGVNVIYFPIKGERRAEFGQPMGAFKTAENAGDVARMTLEHARDLRFNDAAAQAFLARHVSFDPAAPASQRMADFLAAKLQERASFDATRVPAPRLGLGALLDRFRLQLRRDGKNVN